MKRRDSARTIGHLFTTVIGDGKKMSARLARSDFLQRNVKSPNWEVFTHQSIIQGKYVLPSTIRAVLNQPQLQTEMYRTAGMSNSIWAKATSAVWHSVCSFVLTTFRYNLLVSREQLQFPLCELSEAQDGIFKRGLLHSKTSQHKLRPLHQDCVPFFSCPPKFNSEPKPHRGPSAIVSQ